MAKRILFQGDSITDCNRRLDDLYNLGTGYATLVAGSLGAEEPYEYEFINRGIGGNRIVDLYARIKADFINLKPDYASIYIGVNDVWHEIEHNNGVDTPKFEKIYSMMLEEIVAALPNLRLMLIAPFVVEGPCTCNTGEIPNRLELFERGVAEKAAATKRVAERFSLPCIELQPMFDKVFKNAPENHWTRDGVHPTPAGHELIKRAWLEAFEKMK